MSDQRARDAYRIAWASLAYARALSTLCRHRECTCADMFAHVCGVFALSREMYVLECVD